jgi:hypothetical protein
MAAGSVVKFLVAGSATTGYQADWCSGDVVVGVAWGGYPYKNSCSSTRAGVTH